MSKLGVIGGTFDPPHIGHLIISQEALIKLNLDKVIFIPAGRPLFKGRRVTSAALRWEMLNLAISANPEFVSSREEIDRTGPSYTLDTVKALKKEYGQSAEIYLIMGMDAFLDMERWKNPEEIIRLCRIAVERRPGYAKSRVTDLEKALPSLKSRYTFLDAPLIDVSSTCIRRRVKEGASIKYLVPEAVENFIKEKRLYKGKTDSPTFRCKIC